MSVEETLGRAFQGSLFGMALIDLDGRWLEVNPALCRMLGRDAGELVGRSLSELTHPDDVGVSMEAVAQVATSGADLTFEKRYLHADGSVIWCRVTCAVARSDDGRPQALLSQLQDITALKEAASYGEEAFSSAFQDAPIGMALTAARRGDRGGLVRVNAALCAMLRATSEQLINGDPLPRVHPEDVDRFRHEWVRLIRGEIRALAIESRAVRLDGTVFWAATHASVVRDVNGSPAYVVSQIYDTTARRESERQLREAERRFRSAFEDAGTAMALVGTDVRVIKVNRAFCEVLGRPEHELLEHDVRSFLHPGDVAPADTQIERLLGPDGTSYRRSARYVHADGRVIWASVTASIVRDDEGEPLYAVLQLVDVTAEREAEARAELRLAQQSAVAWLGQRALDEHDLDALFETAVNVVAATLAASHAALAVVDAERGVLRLATSVGWPPDTEAGLTPMAGQNPFTLSVGGAVIAEDLTNEDRFSTEILRGIGAASGMSVVVAGVDDQPYGVLSMHSTELRAFSRDDSAFLTSVANVLTGALRRDAAARDLRHQSLHDPLTHLPNRALLLDRLRQGLARARRDGSTLAVLFCDMDDFKYVNDSLGHQAGDRLLAALAPRLQSALRAADTLARFGGDEFVVLCEGLREPAEVTPVADRLLAACAHPLDLGGTEFVPTASIGVAIAPAGAEVDPEALLRDADVAMYDAKSRGKGRYEIFDARMRDETLERIALSTDLRNAAPRGELELAFQPIVSLHRREVAGLEALIRWRHPERGLLMPDEFIGLAEDNGLIHELGRWVIDEAVRHAAAWQRAGTPVLKDVMVGVNVSWRQLSQGALLADVATALDRHGVDARYLCLEVTETALMDDPVGSKETFERLREIGVHLALDDFGTGHSSLSVLRDFPLDTIKLDRSFLAGEGEWAIVRAVAEMARSMRLLVVAEGVELLEQAERAHRLGCDFGQGWLYCRALGPRELEPAVAELADALGRGDVAFVS